MKRLASQENRCGTML